MEITPTPGAKKIAFVSNNTWSMYNFRREVLQYFLLQGHSVIVIAPEDRFAAQLRSLGCTVMPISFDNRSGNPLKDWALYRSLKKIYQQTRPDVIFHYVIKPNIYGSLAAATLGIPAVAVITGLGHSFSKRNALNLVVRRMYRIALKKVHAVWFLNQDDARTFVNAGLANSDRVLVLPGEGVNTDFFSPAPSPAPTPFQFLMSARLLRSKGHEYFVHATEILRSKGYNINSVIIGFAEKNHLDAIAPETLRHWQSANIISFGGFTDDVRAVLASAHCFVLPTHYNEGLSRGILEAASMELPVITTFQRGCKELVIDRSTGFFCNPEDAQDLADKMEQVLLLPEEQRKQMGRAARALVLEKYTISKVIHEYEQLVNKLPVTKTL
jgi:glycosyltransferase involved in cell wall biosynthesis